MTLMKKNLPVLTAVLCAAALLSSCMKFEGTTPPVQSPDDFFDFATTRDYNLVVDYNLTDTVQFEVYAEDPFSEVTTLAGFVQRVKNNDIKPIFRAFTDDKGYFEGTMQSPSYDRDFYIFCNYPGAPALVKATVSGTTISLNPIQAKAAPASKAGVTQAVYQVQDDAFGTFYTLASNPQWDKETGYPNWLQPTRFPVPQRLIDDLSSMFKEGQNTPLLYPEYFTGGKSHDIHISLAGKAPVSMVFLHGITSFNDVIGYYSYVGDAPTSPAEVHRTFVFPNAKYDGMGGGLAIGDQVQLKYWNGTEYEDEFPAGSTIGVFMCSNGYHPYSGTVYRGGGVFYTDHRLSDPREAGGSSYQQGVALFSALSNMVVVGFEDIPFDDPSCDSDFNDVMVGVWSPGIDGELNHPLPEGEWDPESNTLEYAGTLAFEDLWPSYGDYDMNDVVLKYHCKVWRNKGNLITKVEDMFSPIHSGAQFLNGFGYQYGVGTNKIASLEWSTTYPGGKPATFNIDPETCLEKNQSRATIMLFDNINGGVVNPSNPYKYNITTTFVWPLRDWELGVPPYNPFIVKRNKGITQRDTEVHLCGYYPPSDLIDRSYLGSLNDRSIVSSGYYYCAANNMPFAIKFPGEFTWPREGVRIDVAYPDFAKWVASGGWEYTKWWVKE